MSGGRLATLVHAARDRLGLRWIALCAALLCAPLLAATEAPPAAAPAAAPATPGESPPAAEQLKIYVSPDGQTVYLIGMILDGSFKRFDSTLLAAPKARTVFLSSPGGLTLEARMMAALVRKRHLNTYVEQYCASACTQIFVAGQERVIGKDAQLGFHQAVAVDRRGRPGRVNRATDRTLTPTTVFNVNGNDTLRLAYELAGIDKDFITKALERDHEDMWYPSATELADAHVITRVAQVPEFALPDGSVSKDELRANLARRPIWAIGEAQFKDSYEAAFLEVWRLANSGTPLEFAIGSGRGEMIVAMMSRFARSDDSLVDRHLTLYASEARDQAAKGFPACNAAIGDLPTKISDADQQFERSEDALLVEAFSSSPRIAAMTKKDAMQVFVKDIMPLLSDNFSSSNSCKSGFQMIAAIDGLSGKKRIRAYRALLFLPDVLNL